MPKYKTGDRVIFKDGLIYNDEIHILGILDDWQYILHNITRNIHYNFPINYFDFDKYIKKLICKDENVKCRKGR